MFETNHLKHYMRIAISGPACTGKTTLINNFINNWKMYKSPVAHYRYELKTKNMKHSSETTEETQKFILDFMEKQLTEYKDEKYIIYDRSPLDVVVYTLIAAEKNNVSDEFVTDIIRRVRNLLSKLDLILVLPVNEKYKLQSKEGDGPRDQDEDFHKRSAELFNLLMREYYTEFEADVFFPKDDCPGIIALEPDNLLYQVKQVVNKNGDMFDIEDDQKLQFDMLSQVVSKKEQEALVAKLLDDTRKQEELDKQTTPFLF